MKIDKFIIKQYENERPIIKGNGFDGLEIGYNREEAEEFINFINTLVAKAHLYNVLIEKYKK